MNIYQEFFTKKFYLCEIFHYFCIKINQAAFSRLAILCLKELHFERWTNNKVQYTNGPPVLDKAELWRPVYTF